jgi:hypothetical protein
LAAANDHLVLFVLGHIDEEGEGDDEAMVRQVAMTVAPYARSAFVNCTNSENDFKKGQSFTTSDFA